MYSTPRLGDPPTCSQLDMETTRDRDGDGRVAGSLARTSSSLVARTYCTGSYRLLPTREERASTRGQSRCIGQVYEQSYLAGRGWSLSPLPLPLPARGKPRGWALAGRSRLGSHCPPATTGKPTGNDSDMADRRQGPRQRLASTL